MMLLHDNGVATPYLRAQSDDHVYHQKSVSLSRCRHSRGRQHLRPHSIFTGGTFDLSIGSESFTVHKVLVERTSQPLAAMMNIGMRESQSRQAAMEGVDETTFARFVEFLYTGDYNA